MSPGEGRSFLVAYGRGASSNPQAALSGGPKPAGETFGVRPKGIRRTFQILYGESCTLPQILYDKFYTLPHLISRRIF